MSHPPEPLPRALAAIERGLAEGLHLGAQLYVSLKRQVIADRAIGEARVGIPIQPDSIMLWLSSSKPVTAVAVAQLWERRQLDLDDPVTRFIPEFGGDGKEAVIVRHLLTHTGGIRLADKCDLGKEWGEIIDCICRTPLEARWVPGKRAAYHPSASWYILGEIVRRIDGRPIERYVRDEIFEPCGMPNSRLAMSPNEFREHGDRLTITYHTETAAAVPHRKWNTEEDAAVCRPGRNGRGPIRELGRFYETLLLLRQGAGDGSPASVLKPETAMALTSRQRSGMFDDTFQQVIDWGLGFAIDSKRYGREMVPYGFGQFSSDTTFGHGGSQSSCGFADPERELVVAWAFNGLPGERRHQHRAHELNTAIYQDLFTSL